MPLAYSTVCVWSLKHSLCQSMGGNKDMTIITSCVILTVFIKTGLVMLWLLAMATLQLHYIVARIVTHLLDPPPLSYPPVVITSPVSTRINATNPIITPMYPDLTTLANIDRRNSSSCVAWYRGVWLRTAGVVGGSVPVASFSIIRMQLNFYVKTENKRCAACLKW